ncbi:type VI secretion system-associated protein TagF [Variovorax sp. RHLX14]|uniref:type VI secretion system-associated protein TagF n=1 Tax=Variovorax sp. RHLX14 TaxID=1259731 RepID=UPI003F476E90
MKRVIAAHLVTQPAIWGKLPAHSDFVSSGVRIGEQDGWEAWLSAQPHRTSEYRAPASAALPAAFVLPPGALPFAPRRYVVGVVARSFDRTGRPYALLVYQLAHRRWLVRHFAKHAAYPHDWFFWLARAVARHAGLFEAADIRALERATGELWRLHSPNATQLLPPICRAEADPVALVSRSRALLDRLMGAASQDDLARRLAGVRFLPWPDWPDRLCGAGSGGTARFSGARRFEGAFWQQDDAGGFVNAAVRLEALWNGSP